MIHHNKWTLRGILLGSPRFDQSWDRIIRAFDLVNCSSASDAHGTLNPIRVVVEKSKFVTKLEILIRSSIKTNDFRHLVPQKMPTESSIKTLKFVKKKATLFWITT